MGKRPKGGRGSRRGVKRKCLRKTATRNRNCEEKRKTATSNGKCEETNQWKKCQSRMLGQTFP